MDRLPLVNFERLENNRVRVFVCQNTLVCLLLSKVGLLWGEGLIMGKRGSFWILDQFFVKYLSLCFNKCVGLTMGYKFCTIRFKDRSGLGSGFISSHFWTIIYLGPWHFVKNYLDHDPLPPLLPRRLTWAAIKPVKASPVYFLVHK